MDGGARLRPVAVPPPLFRLLSALGGANEFGSASSLLKEGIGVALESDVLSALSGGCTDGDGSALMCDDAGTSAGKSASLSDERRNTMTLLFLVARFVVADDDMMGDVVVDG